MLLKRCNVTCPNYHLVSPVQTLVSNPSPSLPLSSHQLHNLRHSCFFHLPSSDTRSTVWNFNSAFLPAWPAEYWQHFLLRFKILTDPRWNFLKSSEFSESVNFTSLKQNRAECWQTMDHFSPRLEGSHTRWLIFAAHVWEESGSLHKITDLQCRQSSGYIRVLFPRTIHTPIFH